MMPSSDLFATVKVLSHASLKTPASIVATAQATEHQKLNKSNLLEYLDDSTV